MMLFLVVSMKDSETEAKPISLLERCWCRSTLNTVPQRSIREIKFLHTPHCPFQVIAKLKNNREVCINPKTKWLQQYLKNAISNFAWKLGSERRVGHDTAPLEHRGLRALLKGPRVAAWRYQGLNPRPSDQ
ncbi:chemokine (C-X-C motif) ligand 12b (stromal cell-derived factor 1) precursor [Silurus meridionalis]|nr:chemokine (C-X-C motif) ligand 12b (stromal cell-derived factor 1) precursor [Silurus meridionalis]